MSRAVLVLIPIVAVLAACSRESPPAPAATSSVTAAPSAASAADALDRMDTRAPVPLLPMMANHQKQNMRDHLVAVQEIVAAIAQGDFAGIERAVGRIGYSEQVGQMCEHMGAGAPGFTEMALE